MVLADAGLIFPEGDSQELAAQLRCILSDATLRAQLGKKARQRVLKLFSTEKIAAQHYRLYEALRSEG